MENRGDKEKIFYIFERNYRKGTDFEKCTKIIHSMSREKPKLF